MAQQDFASIKDVTNKMKNVRSTCHELKKLKAWLKVELEQMTFTSLEFPGLNDYTTALIEHHVDKRNNESNLLINSNSPIFNIH